MAHTHHTKAFRLFLVLYTAVLVFHMFEVPWRPVLFIGFIAGFLFAIFAHLRSGMLTIALLLIHMAIEWSEYAVHGGHYRLGETVFLALHAVLDIAFLWQEVRAHLYRYRVALFVVVGIGILFALFVAQTDILHNEEASDAHTSIIEPIVLGGILGCTLSHIGIRKRPRT